MRKTESRSKRQLRSFILKVNEVARGLKTNRTKTIGIILPEIEQHFLFRDHYSSGRFIKKSWVCDDDL